MSAAFALSSAKGDVYAQAADAAAEEDGNGVPLKKWRKQMMATKRKHGSQHGSKEEIELPEDDADMKFLANFYSNSTNIVKGNKKGEDTSLAAGVFDVIIIGAGWAGIAACELVRVGRSSSRS